MEILLSGIVVFVWALLLALSVITTVMVSEGANRLTNVVALFTCIVSGLVLTYFACVLLTLIERSYYGIS